MLKSRRLAVLPIDRYDLGDELDLVDKTGVDSQYDAFTLGEWKAYVLANGSGADSDTAFRPHDQGLSLTELGTRLPTVMRLVTTHFKTENLQWVRIFGLREGILAPHVDFLEFDKPGVRIQVPLRTGPQSLHSENDLVYHLRRGEVWSIHTTDPHSARSFDGPARLSLCLDFDADGFDPAADILGDVPATADVHIVTRPALPRAEVDALIAETAATVNRDNMRELFRRFAEVHFVRQAHATDTFDWFIEACRASQDPSLAERARAFRTYCVEKRAYAEGFDW